MSKKPTDEQLVHWQNMATSVNAIFHGEEVQDVGGTLAILTGLLIAGLVDEPASSPEKRKAQILWMLAEHSKLIAQFVPAFLETIEEAGGDAAFKREMN